MARHGDLYSGEVFAQGLPRCIDDQAQFVALGPGRVDSMQVEIGVRGLLRRTDLKNRGQHPALGANFFRKPG